MLMISSSKRATTSLMGFAIGNLALQIFLKISLKLFWKMMAILQIIVNLPLLNIPIPANVVIMFKSMIAISQFEIMGKDFIRQHLFSWLDDTNQVISARFVQNDIF